MVGTKGLRVTWLKLEETLCPSYNFQLLKFEILITKYNEYILHGIIVKLIFF